MPGTTATIHFGTYNAMKASISRCRSIIKDFNQHYKHFVIALQEVPKWDNRSYKQIILRCGSVACKSTVGFVLPKRLFRVCGSEKFGKFWGVLQLQNIIYVSVHLSDASKCGSQSLNALSEC